VRRMLITLAATVTGTAAVVAYQPALQREADSAREAMAGQGADDVARLAAADLVGNAGADETPGAPQDRAPQDRAPQTPGGTASATTAAWVDGPAVDTAAGAVRVRVRLEGGAIRDVRLLTAPHGTRHSAWLSRHAAEILRAETLKAQSADIDMVSGATYTSEGYLRSLQAALDSAEGS
jgi:uncharacterized protein with FMN-binding domain